MQVCGNKGNYKLATSINQIIMMTHRARNGKRDELDGMPWHERRLYAYVLVIDRLITLDLDYITVVRSCYKKFTSS